MADLPKEDRQRGTEGTTAADLSAGLKRATEAGKPPRPAQQAEPAPDKPAPTTARAPRQG